MIASIAETQFLDKGLEFRPNYRFKIPKQLSLSLFIFLSYLKTFNRLQGGCSLFDIVIRLMFFPTGSG
jgi:hypothetical protein